MFNTYYAKYYVTSWMFLGENRLVKKKITRREFDLLAKKFGYGSTGIVFQKHTIDLVFLSEEDLVMYVDAFAKGLYYNVTVVHPNGSYVVFLDEKAYEWMYTVAKKDYPKHMGSNAYFFDDEFKHYMNMYKVIRSIDENLEEG